MGTRIQDTLNLADKFRDKINDLKAIAEAFRHGDLLVKNYNNFLADMKSAIDNGDESTYTKEDFDDLLDMRNELFGPIMQNMAFIQQFERYNPVIPVITPDYDPTTEMLGEKYYDEVAKVYTYYIVPKVVLLNVEKQRLIAELNTISNDIVILVQKALVLNNAPVDAAIMQAINNFYLTTKTEIYSLTEETVSQYSINYNISDGIIENLKNLL